MDIEKIKLIVKNMDLLVQSLKEEIKIEEKKYEEIVSYLNDYDEIYDEDEN